MLNEIVLRRRNKLTISNGEATQPNIPFISTILKNIENLGYTFSADVIDVLKTLPKKSLEDFYLELVPMLKNMVGADVKYHPMYPNFPQSVMEKEEAELYLNAIIHYISGGTLYPAEKESERLPLFEDGNVKVLHLAAEDELQDIFTLLCASKTSISDSDKADLKWIIEYGNVTMPDEIPLKENVAVICKVYLENAAIPVTRDIQKYFKTATDVLRLVTAMSDGDVSLSTNCKFRSFKRKERRIFMELLENCGNLEEDMLRYKNRWLRVGERLHPAEYSKEQFPKTTKAFEKLRTGEKIETFGGKVNKAMDAENYETALALLKKRPGELARKLDYLLRTAKTPNMVVNTFKDIAGDVSTPVLLQVKEHFAHRNEENENRVFFPKGNLSRCHSIKNTLPEIEESYCNAIVSICENALIEAYRKKDFMGKVYLSPEFKNYLVPFSQRSASKSLKTIVRGSRLHIAEDIKTLRAFIWWTNTIDKSNDWDEYRVDIDLSAAIFDENWNYMEHISYTNLRSRKYQACHSGDITNGGPVNGDGVSEFLDVDIDSVVKYGARYVVYQVYSFTNQTFKDLPHAMFGWMGRESAGSGEIYEPKTVEQKMDLTANSTIAIPVIFDCVNREIIWCDMNQTLDSVRCNHFGNNLESNLSGVAATCYGVVNIRKPNLYDLISLHIKARGIPVDTKEEADVIFDVNDGNSDNNFRLITPFDLDIIQGELL